MKLINADCILAMREMPDNSIDSIVTDPPYELGFMGKAWDSTGIANSVEMWREALRVLKPGGHLLAFSGSRTYHRMTCAIEDAGFEIRDQIMWVYGSGFPKSHNISKGIDKANGTLKVIGKGKAGKTALGQSSEWNKTNNPHEFDLTEPNSPEAQQWDGWGTALKPAHEPIVLARKPLIGTVAQNVLTFGTGGLNIDGSRVGSEVRINQPMGAPQNSYGGYGATATATATEGRWPANFIHDGSEEVLEGFPYTKSGAMSGEYNNTIMAQSNGNRDGKTIKLTQQANEGSAARFFYCAKTSKSDRNEGALNHHPTVKPTQLMRYLCRLITPPNGVVLDPFMGSGSTGKAAVLEGFDFIGIDQSLEYVEIARARIEYAKSYQSKNKPLESSKTKKKGK